MTFNFDKNYFDSFGQDKGYSLQKNNPKYKKRLNELKVLGKSKGKLLDIGCGFGFFLDEGKKQGFKTYGIDISRYAIKKSKKNHQVITINICQRKTKFKNNFFDVAVLDHVLEHMENPWQALKEVKRVLKPQGLLFIEVPIRQRWPTEKSHISYFNKISLSYLLTNLSFKILKIGEEGGRWQKPLGLFRLLIKGNTIFNFVPPKTGLFLICYAQKL